MRILRYLIGVTILLATASVAPVGAQAELRLGELLASADQAWGARKYDVALDKYQAVLQRDSTAARAVFRVATLLSWRNDLGRAETLFRYYLRLAPGDDDGRNALARTLAWSGRYDQAIALADSVVASNPRQRDAALLAAQATAWSGNRRDAIARYERWLAAHADDSDAWAALAQTWGWANRPDEARKALLHALSADPHNAAATTQLEWINAALMPSFEPTVSSTNDSDDNRSTTYAIRGGWATPWNGRLFADGSYRVADLTALHGTAATLRASSSWTPLDGQWTLRGELGASRLDATDGAGTPGTSRLEPIVAARLSGHIAPRLSLGGGFVRAPFDETAPLILAGIATTSVDVDGDFAIARRISLGGGGGWTQLSGGSGPNARVAASTTLRWSLARFVSVAAGVRGFSYEHAAADGYFTPKRYLLSELSSRWGFGRELGWRVESEVGVGDQMITAFDNSTAGRFAQRVSASVLYRPAPGAEWAVSGGFANVASPTTMSSGDYRAFTLAIKGRVRL